MSAFESIISPFLVKVPSISSFPIFLKAEGITVPNKSGNNE